MPATRPVIGAEDGLSGRIVLFDASTALSVKVEWQGEAATLSSLSLILVESGTDKTTLTVANGGLSVSGNVVTATITTTHLDAVLNTTSAQGRLNRRIQATWICSVSGYTTQVRWRELLWVAEAEIYPTVLEDEITAAYGELVDSDAYPDGVTTWDGFRQRGFRRMWNGFEQMKIGQPIWRVVDTQALHELEYAYVMDDIATWQASVRSRDSYWAGIRDYFRDRISAEWTRAKAAFSTGTVAALGDETAVETRAIKQPVTIQGNSRPSYSDYV